nr:Chain B, Crb-3 [Homo sapiens]
LPPEERLI